MNEKTRAPSAIGNNPERNREHNRRVVLDLVRQHGMLGRMEIARRTHLTAQAVANIVDDLVGENLLMSTGRRRTGRGQPPIQFAVNPEGAATIGVEIATDQMVVTVLDLTGVLRYKRIVPLTDTTPERTLPVFALEVERARKSVEAPLLGVGVVMPGPFGIEGMSFVGPTTLPGWSGIDVKAALETACGVDVTLENDAAAAAVAERLFGAGHAISHFCMLYFGTGIGLGMIQDGAPYRGAFGNAGEIGHVPVVPGGRPCPCGQHGCLERYASLHALHERLDNNGRQRPQVYEIESLFTDSDPIVEEWLGEAASHLSTVIGLLENIFDPETIILSGAFSDAVMDALIARMPPLPPSVAARSNRSQARVMRGQTGQYTAALGAAALPLFEILTPKLETSPPDQQVA
ncbi:ROK family protein [Martelella lutilitoris]|uniref:ROK family protein n=1 Tax=Martelella lutilitoris TaxID=2583532 RepID=A0A5C4JMQ2_9HYPH|nr:ROK family transcriptional regulator [Martelella lutilitoris]TNB46736.1 ROK family protein [Martelella lutilitoris]